jgi:hypothetical protein
VEAANSKSGVYAMPSTIQLTGFILRCLVSVGTMVICRSLRGFAYNMDPPLYTEYCGMYSYHSASVLQHCTQLILLNFPRIACTSKSLPKSPGQRSKVQFPPAEHCMSRIPWTRRSAAQVPGTRHPATSAYIA